MASLPAMETAPKGAQPPFPLPRVEPPAFPPRRVDIRQHGAVGDGATDCTEAIAAAIAACASAGGGRVVIPSGQWLTGPIHLRSNIDLHVKKGAVVRFSTDPRRYRPPVFVRWGGQECYNLSPLIYARDCRNVAITGSGILLGQGAAWRAWEGQEQRALRRLYQMVLRGVPVAQRVFDVAAGAGAARLAEAVKPGTRLRPQFILAINCTNLLLEDFTIAEGGPFWTVHVAYGQGVLVRRLRITAMDAPNNDGIVIDSSRNVVIEDCQLQSSDDCIALKSGLNEDGWRVGKPTENVVIRRISATRGTGVITIGSEMSGGVRNVFVCDCRCDGASAGIRFKAARGRGGVVEDVYVQDVTMGRISGEAIQLTTEYASFFRPNGTPPAFRNIRIRNISCQQARTAVRMIGLADAPFRGVSLEQVTIAADEGLYCAAVSDIRLVDVRITPRTGPVLSVKDAQGVLIDGLNQCDGGNIFLDLRGRQTRDIRLRDRASGNASRHARPSIALAIDVPRDALVHE